SHLSYFVIFWGPFLFLSGSLVVAELALGLTPFGGNALRGRGPAWTRSPLFWAGVGALALAAYAAQAPALTLILPMLVGSAALIARYLDGCTLPGTGRAETMRVRHETVTVGTRSDEQPATVAGGATPAYLAVEHVYVF